FFQAEDGIRDFHVTGVQTCALPISFPNPAPWASWRSDSRHLLGSAAGFAANRIAGARAAVAARLLFGLCNQPGALQQRGGLGIRSEERRVGKECESREAPDD